MAHFDPDKIELTEGRGFEVDDDIGGIDETSFNEQPTTSVAQQAPGEKVSALGEELLKDAVNTFYKFHKERGDIPTTCIDYSKFVSDNKGQLRLKAYPNEDIIISNHSTPYVISSKRMNSNVREELGFVGWKASVRSKNDKVVVVKKLDNVLAGADKVQSQSDGGDVIKRSTTVINTLEDPKIREALATIEDEELDQRDHETTVKIILERGTERGIPDDIMDRELKRRKLIELREVEDATKAFALIRQEVVRLQAEISQINTEIAHREQKIRDAPNEEARRLEEQERDKLIDKKEDHLKAIDNLHVRFNNQLTQIRESIMHFLNDDNTLGERLRNLFREQGVTIVSILTAFSMVISTLVLAITGDGAQLSPPQPPPPSDKGGVKEWVKQRIQDLGRLLGKLADKAAAALPGIIGSIVSWLLSTAQKAAGWLAENLWALIVGVAGLLYLTVKDYLVAKHMSLAKPKKD